MDTVDSLGILVLLSFLENMADIMSGKIPSEAENN